VHRPQGRAPFVIAFAPLGIIAAGDRPAADVLGAGGDAEQLAGIRVKRLELFPYPFGIDGLIGAPAPPTTVSRGSSALTASMAAISAVNFAVREKGMGGSR